MATTVSNLKFFPVKHKSIKANGFVTLDNKWTSKFTIRLGSKGLFISWPSTPYKDKEGKDVWSKDFAPASKEIDFEVQKLILAEYSKTTGYQPAPTSQEADDQSSDLVPF